VTTYVVTKDKDGMGRIEILYAGQDADDAFSILDDVYVYDRPAFLHVWDDGEHQYCTREHPESLSR